MRLSLTEAIKSDRLSDFIAIEEARGIGPINRPDFDAFAATLIKAPRSVDQTSHSSSAVGSTGKKTRRGSVPYVSG